jgi:hypothetical protein
MGKHRTDETAEALVTWRSAVTVNALIAIAAVLAPSSGVLNLPGIGRPFVTSRIVTMVLTIGLIGVLIPQRNDPRLSVVLALFALPAIPSC